MRPFHLLQIIAKRHHNYLFLIFHLTNESLIHDQRAGNGYVVRRIVDGLDLNDVLAFGKDLFGESIHLGTQQVDRPDRVNKGAEFFPAHFDTDQLGALRTGSQKGIEVFITAERDAFVDAQHIGDLPVGFSADGEDPGSTKLPGSPPECSDILPVFRPEDADLKISEVFGYQFFYPDRFK